MPSALPTAQYIDSPDLDDKVKTYVPTPTLRKFHNSPAWVRCVMGPFGSGKSVACCMEIMKKAVAQEPWRGVRSTKWAIIRNTYPQLRSTTIQTWTDWFQEPFCKMTYGSPITGKIHHLLPDGTWLDVGIEFLSLDRTEDIRKVTSLEITGLWLNEVREMRKSLVDAAMGRVDRYPPPIDGGCT